jgi:carboxyl-terminal processing protease
MRVFWAWALCALLLVGLGGCAGGASDPYRVSEDIAARTIAQALEDVEKVYYRETEASALVKAGLAAVEEGNADLRFVQQEGSTVANVGGKMVFAFETAADHGAAEAWGERVAAALRHIAPVDPEAGPNLAALTDSFLQGVTESLDARTRYASRQDARVQRLQWSGKIGTVGISIDRGPSGWEVEGIDDADLVVSQSLRPGDVIVEIDGTAVADLTKREVQILLHGKIGGAVVFTIERAGAAARSSVTLLRREAGGNPVSSFPVGKSTHIVMTGFTNRAVTDLRTVLAQQTNSGLGNSNGLILDLRGNPGGLLTAVIDTAKMFLSRGPIFATHGRHPDSHRNFNAPYGTYAESPPLVLLLDENSAAGSEILAAALQDRVRAVIIGSTSYGAGTIQTVFPLPNHGEFVLTWAEIHTPTNYRLDKRGVIPTVCTGGKVTAEEVVGALRSGGGIIDRTTRIRAIDPEDTAAVEAFRALCPPREDHDEDVALEVARTILADPALYDLVLAAAQ